MKHYQYLTLASVFAIAISGCTTNRCDAEQPHDGLTETQPLVIPEGVKAPAGSGQYQLPPRVAASGSYGGGCLATPPMNLPADVLVDPEDASDEG